MIGHRYTRYAVSPLALLSACSSVPQQASPTALTGAPTAGATTTAVSAGAAQPKPGVKVRLSEAILKSFEARGDFCSETFDRLQLEAGKLQHVPLTEPRSIAKAAGPAAWRPSGCLPGTAPLAGRPYLD